MNEEQERLWGVFTATGRVEDYLQYKASLRNAYGDLQVPYEAEEAQFTDNRDDEDRERWL